MSQHVAREIRHLLASHTAPVPAVLEIPSTTAPYSPDDDAVFQRVKALFGGEVAGGERV